MTAQAARTAGDADQVACAHLDTVAKFFRALGDPTRLKLLECVDYAGISQPRVSIHLSCLVDCGYVTARRDGRRYQYSVDDPRVADLVIAAHALAADNSGALEACPIIDAAAAFETERS
jgi:DNA-binding transcriptional ArsR family regulator